MPVFKYRPYYCYNGPSILEPLREKLSVKEVQENIDCFFTDIKQYFDNDNLEIKKEGDYLTVIGEINQDDCDKVIKKCLNNLDLFADKIADT